MRFLQPQLDNDTGAVSVNWWEAGGATGALAVYQPKGAASLAASYTDLSGNNNDAYTGSAPTWNSTDGWIFAGAEYLYSGIVPGESYSTIVGITNLAYDNGILFGERGDPRHYIQPRSTPVIRFAWAAGSWDHSTSDTAPVLCLARDTGYYNGSSVVTVSSTWSGTSDEIAIGGLNRGAFVDTFATAYIQAFAIYDNELSSDQVAAITTAIQAL